MAVTVINTLYPPLIETFQPAFLYSDSVPIVFSLSPFNNIDDIRSIHISVVDQRNNSNVLYHNKPIAPQIDIATEEETEYQYGIINGILIAEMPLFNKQDVNFQIKGLFQYDPINNLYSINISPEWLNKTDKCWNNNQYYQVQIRFDSCEVTEWQSSIFDGYMLNSREYFSEWSSVTLIKPILEPIISITQLDVNNVITTTAGSFHISGCVTFKKDVMSEGISWPETELLQAYKIITWKKAVPQNIEIDNSDWIYARHNLLKTENTSIDYLLDLTNTNNNDELIIEIICRTNNGYVFSQSYPLKIKKQAQILTNIKWNNKQNLADNVIDVNQEDGIAQVRFSAMCDSLAKIYFRRASSKDNFKTWELIYTYDYNRIQLDEHSQQMPVEIPFDDYTISSLYKYQYSVQACVIDSTNMEQWKEQAFSAFFYPKFYEMLLMRQNKQIAIRYNGQVSSWKPTVNRQKIDTLGGKYPKFVENAIMNYKTYSISGLITAEEDFNRKFLSELDDNRVLDYDEEFNTKYIIRNDSAADGENLYPNLNQIHGLTPSGATITGADLYENGETFGGQLFNEHDSYPQDHWYWEREFREQLVAWLNDGEPKLYRSMPEGNIAVILTDINLTPNEQLGRRLYNFNATMYEIGDGYSLKALDSLGIITIPILSDIFSSTSNFYTKTNNIDESNVSDWQLGQITLSTYLSLSDWVNGVTDISNTETLWDNMSLKEKLDEYWNGYNGTLDIVQNSIKLKNIEIQFTTSPHYFTYDNEKGFQLSNNITNWLGYVIQIVETGKNIESARQIFINQKGYYHIPDSIDVANIQILNDNNNTIHQEAKILYQYQYKTKPAADKTETHHIELGDIVGQFNRDMLPLNTDIISLIYQDYQKIEYKNRAPYAEIHLKNCLGCMLDVTPYTYFKYKQNNIDRYITVGQTGIFNAFENWPIDSLELLGRRMIIINPSDNSDNITAYPYHIEEWQCYKDINGNINNPKINGIYTINNQQQIYYIDRQWYPIETINNSTDIIIAKVPIYGMINYHGELEKEIF